MGETHGVSFPCIKRSQVCVYGSTNLVGGKGRVWVVGGKIWWDQRKEKSSVLTCVFGSIIWFNYRCMSFLWLVSNSSGTFSKNTRWVGGQLEGQQILWSRSPLGAKQVIGMRLNHHFFCCACDRFWRNLGGEETIKLVNYS